jgi:hypothetical protein
MSVPPPSCRDNPDWFGHAQRSSRTTAHCDAMTAQGYSGHSCDQYQDENGVTATQACSVACSGGDVKSCPEYDNCWDSPCLNGGVCTDGVGIFTCACPPPLASTTDAEDYCSDECASRPCLNGVCVDGIGTFTCDCAGVGRLGLRCESPPVCEDDATWAGCRYPHCENPVGCDVMSRELSNGYSCDQYQDAGGVTASQACTVACSGGDVTSCQAYLLHLMILLRAYQRPSFGKLYCFDC